MTHREVERNATLSPSMATSSIFSAFLSFISPTKPPPKQQQHLTLFPSFTSFPSHNHKLSNNNLVPLVSQYGRSSDITDTSLEYADAGLFDSPFNVEVVVEDGEPEERLLNRFRREVMRAGVIQECKRRRFFENKQDKKKRKSREAAKRNRRTRRPHLNFATQNKEDSPTTKKQEDDDDDNWDLPEGGIF